MDRRTFVQGAFGLVVLAGSGAGVLSASGCAAATPFFTTPATGEPETAVGPLMMAGIDLLEVPGAPGIAAFFGDTELFDVDKTGAKLVMLADGTRGIDDIAAEAAALGQPCEPVDVALFFSSLSKAGFLRNKVQVSIVENPE